MESSAPTANELLLENGELRIANSSMAARNKVLEDCLKKILSKLSEINAHALDILNSVPDRPIQQIGDGKCSCVVN